MNEWITIARPGMFGRRKQERVQGYNSAYGEDGWRIMWQWGEEVVDFLDACSLYEDAYYHDSLNRSQLWERLAEESSDVYDHQISNTESGRDYNAQRPDEPTHLQDISIRRVIFRRGLSFRGSEPVQIRSHADYWGAQLSPGRVPFHLPKMITPQHVCPKWCDRESIECFYQDNKILQVKK
jgi:hypothetical protein